MKKFLILVFAVVVLTGINISMTFANELRQFEGKVTSLEMYSGDNYDMNQGLVDEIVHVDIEITRHYRESDYEVCQFINGFSTEVPNDSPFVPLLIKAYETQKPYLFNVDVEYAMDTIWHGKLLGIKTLPPGENPPDPIGQIHHEIGVLNQRITDLEGKVDGTKTETLNKITQLHNQHIDQNVLLNTINNTVAAIKKEILKLNSRLRI